MKIFHLIDSGGLYGAEQMLLALTEEQIKQGLEPIILSCGLPNEADKPLEIEAEKRNIPVIKWRMKSGLNFSGAWKILKLAKKEKVDILHSHGYKFNILFAIFPKFARKIPFITTVHGYVAAKKYSAMWFYQIIDKIALKKADFICLVSPAMKTHSAFKKLKVEKIEVILNGIDVALPKQKVNKTNENERKFQLLAIGRLAEEKGFDTLINAIALLKDQVTSLHLTIMGEGELSEQLTKLVQKQHLCEIVNFPGFVKNPAQYFDNYSALVMPSTTEGVPITLLEALRGNLIVIASKVGGIPIVLGENYEYLIPHSDSTALANSILRLYQSDKNDVKVMLDKNHSKFLGDFNSQTMADKYHNVYIDLKRGFL